MGRLAQRRLIYSLDYEDAEINMPANGGLHKFPIWVGAGLFTLGPETKGQSSKRVDVPFVGLSFASGITSHYWYLQLMKCKEALV
jgi:hypothetical protein